MAKLTRDDIVKLAHLARISLSDAEIDEFVLELDEIIQYVEQLQAVDVGGLVPTNQVTGLVNVMRKDEILDYGYKTDALLQNVPELEGELIKVKRMIG